jgi:aminoglycoside 6-adenylyltransferase
VKLIQRIVAEPQLPDDFDNGYRVLFDKDRLTEGLKPPSYRAYIPSPPSEATYQALVEEFYNETTYVAKNLWRDELIFMKYNLDYVMKFQCLCRMLEWRMEIDAGWSLKTGAYGKGLEKHLPPEIWAELELTYVGAETEENWEALFKTIEIFRKVAMQVADHLGYAYPHDLERRVRKHLYRVKNLDRGEKSL